MANPDSEASEGENPEGEQEAEFSRGKRADKDVSGATILYIDDVVNIRRIVKRKLQKNGYTVESASTVEEGRKYLEESNITLALLDVMLPGTSGIEFCREIKNSEQYSDIPVIILTAKRSRETLEKARDAGADDFMVKPFQSEVLVEKLSQLVGEENGS